MKSLENRSAGLGIWEIVALAGLIFIIIGALALTANNHKGLIWVGVGCIMFIPEATIQFQKEGFMASGCAGVVLIVLGAFLP